MQAVQLLGMKADDLAHHVDGGADGKDRVAAIFARAQFTQWQMRVQTRTRCDFGPRPGIPSKLGSSPQMTLPICLAGAVEAYSVREAGSAV